MYALSIHQPWAWAILNVGKNVENRRWRTRYRGPLLIHAGKSSASYEFHAAGWEAKFGMRLPPWEELTIGTLLGVVEVVDCVRTAWPVPEVVEVPGLGPSKWAEPESWCWILADPRSFEVPVPCRGGQRLFKVPDAILPVEFLR